MSEDGKRTSNHPLALVLWVNATLLVVIIVVLMSRGNYPSVLPAAYAQQLPTQAPIAGGAGVFVMPAQFSSVTWGCYLLDIDAQTLVAYQFQPGEKNLRLIAARNFRYDRRLARFNTTPDPDDVRVLIEKEKDTARVLEHNTQVAPPEAPTPNN